MPEGAQGVLGYAAVLLSAFHLSAGTPAKFLAALHLSALHLGALHLYPSEICFVFLLIDSFLSC